MKSRFGRIGAVLVMAALATTNLVAGTFVVTSTADSGNGTLRQAILDANAGGGGNIVFSNTTGVITLGSQMPLITAGVNIIGPGTNLLTVSGSNAYMIFGVSAGTTNTFSDFTIANSYAESYTYASGHSFAVANFPGTAISNRGTLTVTGCVISNCVNDGLAPADEVGGAVYNTGSLGMQNCLFVGCGAAYNDSGLTGGCIYNTGFLGMTNCCLTNCNASDAPGIYTAGVAVLNHCLLTDLTPDDDEGNGGAIFGGNVTLISCVLSNCGAGWEGGAFFGNDITASNTVFAICRSDFEGGGFYITGSNFFYNCTIAGCGTGEYGGGAVKNFGNTTFVNCTISSNSAGQFSGAGIYNLGQISMTNCTLSGNDIATEDSAGSAGGAILNATKDVETGATYSNVVIYLTDCTIVSNNAALGTGGGIMNEAGAFAYAEDTIIADNSTNDFVGVLTSGGYNLIENTNGCAITGTTTGNIYGQDPMVGPLQNNGGFTMTHALLSGSPCINAGPANAPPYFDQRGVKRPQGPADDIGSYEYGGAPPAALIALAPCGNGNVQILFSGIPGFNYGLQRANSPIGPWISINNITPAADGTVCCQDTNPPTGSAFYRTVSQTQ